LQSAHWRSASPHPLRRADYAVIKFKDTGYCRAWYDHTAKPWGTSQVLWVKVDSWDAAQTKGTYAMGHKWCKGWDK
jgi:hypothetical protein